MTHPSSLVLESFAVGEPLPPSHATHLETCAACAAFVEELRGVVAGGPSASVADATVAKLGELAAAGDVRGERGERGEREHATPPQHGAPRALRSRAWMLATSVVAPLAAAAAIVILARSSAPPGSAESSSTPATASPQPPTMMTIQMAPKAAAPAEPETQFKGGRQVAVVRERGGKQERFSSMVRVRPGDRLRVEVALDQEQAILGAVLADDGSYIELMPLGTRGPGTHFSERSAKIDATPTRGTILIGAPEAVAHARSSGLLTGVSTLRVEWEAP